MKEEQIKIGYLAPLNFDRYFKKVFSDLKIAKRFLEDFLDITISEIEAKPSQRYLTDDAKYVELDFRCKIDDNFIIIEMQQWYKPDIVQRFYLYDALNTGLQLEELTTKTIELPGNQIKEIKDYRSLLPTITIIWLVDDNLHFENDYISFVPSPEEILTFIRDVKIWRKPDLDKILEEREKLLPLINNKTKDIDFLQKNKLIFAFQKNIVKNKRYKKYYVWFELAQKTLKRVTDKLEFSEYEKDEILSEVVRRLKKHLENPEDIKYIKERSEYIEKIKRYEDGVKHYADIEAKIDAEKYANEKYKKEIEKSKIEIEKSKIEIKKTKVEIKKSKTETEKAKNEAEKAKNETEKAKKEAEKAKEILEMKLKNIEEEKEKEKLKSKIILLYHAEKKTIKEISELLNIQINTIEKILVN